MKPDGLPTAPSEPMEAEGTEPVTGSEEESQNGTTQSLPQLEANQIEQGPSTLSDGPRKAGDSKIQTKSHVNGKVTASGPASTRPGTQPKVTQTRGTNGLTKNKVSTMAKKPVPATTGAEKKKPTTTVRVAGSITKPPGPPSATNSKPQPKATTVGNSRSTANASTTNGTKTGASVTTSSSLSKRPATSASGAGARPKTTAPAPKPGTAPAAKPSTSASAKTTAPKTHRVPISSTARSTTASVRSVTNTTTTTVLNRTSRTAVQQPVKPLAVTAIRKDAGKASSTGVPKRTAASTVSSKATNLEAKRPPPSSKPAQLKQDDKKTVPTRKVPPSPRNNPSRPALSKNFVLPPNHKQAGASGVKLLIAKPTQSVVPLVKGKPTKKEPSAKPEDAESAVESVQLSAATATISGAGAIVMEESEPEATPTAESAQEAVASSFGRQEDVYVEGPNIISQNNLVVSEAHESPSKALSASPIVSLESDEHVSVEHNDELVEAVAPTFVEATEQETIAKIPCGVEFAEKVEPINTECFEDAEEEEKEGSQQISVSEMSGTQPTEESRPGSAGLAGSVWRAGALFSELDSEDVSCSQHGASELSAPGVLEGTESMDDLGEASLKGADGEGASVGSPDFEKVPDILNNEDEDDSDRVCDMDVGSERAEDSHKQIHDYDEEDEDVEMASEGVTESGLESYGNADEDDLTDDYRLDNLNRIQPPPSSINSSAGPWNQASCLVDAPQPSTTILTSPSSGSCLGDPETQEQLPVQASLDASFEKGPTFPLSCNISEPAQTLQLQSSLTSEETDICPKPDLTQTCMSGMPVEQTSDSTKDASKPDYVKDGLFSTETHSEGDLEQTHLKPIPDVQSNMQDLDGQLDHADEEEEPETLPADDLLGGQAATVSSSATEDEASETEGEMQINDLEAEIPAIENSYRSAAVTQNLSTLEEREETGGENEVIGGGGGNETPQSATSAASYGFDYMTSSSNAQSSAESCSKSPGIFSLENEDQLPDEAKDPSLLNELTLMPTSAAEETIVSVKEGDIQSHQETQDMFCGESVAVPVKSGLTDPSSPPHLEEEQGAETQPPYYSTVCEKTDGPVEERSSFPSQPNELLSIQMALSSKLRLRPRASHVTQPPRLPTDLPPRIPNMASNTQLRYLVQHQQHLQEIQQRQEQRHREQESQETKEEIPVEPKDGEEEESRKLLELQLKQQEEELMQRQQIMNWQKELQQQPPKPKAHTPVLLSPTTPLTTIYETVEKSDDDEETLDQSSSLCPKEDRKKNGSNICSHHTRTSESITLNRETPPDLKIQSPVGSPERPPPLEFDWGKKVDIVQQLINQTLLLTGDGCSPLLLLPGGAGGTLSPLESSLWPNLLPPLTPPSATVTSVSSFSPEATGSSAQGEWTVVELETHH